MKKSNKSAKEDFLAPTKLPDQEKNDKANLSDAELRERIEHYASLSENDKDRWSFIEMSQRYGKQREEHDQNRNKQAIHYSQGISSGLPHASYEKIQYQHEREEQNLRDQIAEEAKEVYRQGSSLSKKFEQSNSADKETMRSDFDKVKDDPGDRDR